MWSKNACGHLVNRTHSCGSMRITATTTTLNIIGSHTRYYTTQKDFLEKVQRKAESMSQQLKEERKELFSQTRKLTTWAETNEMVWHGGKSLEGLPYLIKKKNAFVFPATPKTCYSLATGEHLDISEYIIRNQIKSCLVVVTFTAFSAEMAKTWIEPYAQAFSGYIRSPSHNSSSHSNTTTSITTLQRHKPVMIFDMTISQGTLVRFLRNTIMRSMKANTPSHLIESTLACYPESSEQKNAEYFDARLDINNSKNCYVFLLDRDARVRWRAVGNATDKEFALLKKLTAQILNGE